MGMQEYRHILQQVCASTHGWNAAEILEGRPLRSNDVPVWLQYFEPADLCRIVVDLGALDGDFRATVWQMMLESNCTNTSSFLPVLSLSPANGHAILVMHLSMTAFQKHSEYAGFSSFLSESLAPVMESWRKGTEATLNLGHASGKMLVGGFA